MDFSKSATERKTLRGAIAGRRLSTSSSAKDRGQHLATPLADRQMLEYTQAGTEAHLMMRVLHDDAVRDTDANP